MLTDREVIRHSDAKHLDRSHTANVRYLWRLTFSVVALAISRLDPVKSQIVILCPLVYMIQFCLSGVGINSWDHNMGVVGVREHQISSFNCGEICEQTDIPTDNKQANKHTGTLIAILRTLTVGKLSNSWQKVDVNINVFGSRLKVRVKSSRLQEETSSATAWMADRG